MKNYNIISIIVLLFVGHGFSFGQDDTTTDKNKDHFLNQFNYQIKTGFSIGGMAPLGLPREIRSITSYNPTLVLSIEANLTKWFGAKEEWGVKTGIRFEQKGMKTEADVKNYGMEINYSGDKVSGYWTGGVKTNVKNTYLTIPLLATYKLSPRWLLSAGNYYSFLIDKDFSGYVYEGYLREETPIGQKITIDGGETASYDFSRDQRIFQWGAQIGGEWKANKHLSLYSDLTWGFNDIFHSNFKTMTFKMYPIYLNMGFGYTF